MLPENSATEAIEAMKRDGDVPAEHIQKEYKMKKLSVWDVPDVARTAARCQQPSQ